MAKDQVVEEVETEVDDRMDVQVVEAKEGIVMKAKRHWKVIAAAAAAGVVLVGAKLLKNRKETNVDDDFDEFDDFDDDVIDSTEATDPE